MAKEKNTVLANDQKKASDTGTNKPARRGLLMSILDGSFLTREGILRQLPFIGYIVLLLILYISISYHAEKTAHEIDQTKTSLIELRFEYITAKSLLMNSTNMSELTKVLAPIGVKPSHTPPYKLFTTKTAKDE